MMTLGTQSVHYKQLCIIHKIIQQFYFLVTSESAEEYIVPVIEDSRRRPAKRKDDEEQIKEIEMLEAYDFLAKSLETSELEPLRTGT